MTEHKLRIFMIEGVDQDELGTALGDPDLAWAYAERTEESSFLDKEDLPPLSRWLHGRAFGPDKELDWWREENPAGVKYRLRLMTDLKEPPTGLPWKLLGSAAPWTALHDFDLAAGQVRLAGKRSGSEDQPAWFEARLPRMLHYPSLTEDPPERVALRVRRYRDQSGAIWTRMVCLEAAEQERGA